MGWLIGCWGFNFNASTTARARVLRIIIVRWGKVCKWNITGRPAFKVGMITIHTLLNNVHSPIRRSKQFIATGWITPPPKKKRILLHIYNRECLVKSCLVKSVQAEIVRTQTYRRYNGDLCVCFLVGQRCSLLKRSMAKLPRLLTPGSFRPD